MLIFPYSYINTMCPRTDDKSIEYHVPQVIVFMFHRILLTYIKGGIWQLVRRIEILSFVRIRKCWVRTTEATTEPLVFILETAFLLC